MISLNEALEYAISIKPRFNLEQFCFKEQLDFINDPHNFKTAVCSRRAGKTIACAADLIYTALSQPDVVCLYITLSRKNAKRIIWPEIIKINREFNLGGHLNETELSITFPNQSIIYISGAKDKSEIENYRGLPLKKVYVDECQSFRSYIGDLIDDVLSKALFDYAGTICLIGTPGMVPAGYFYDTTQSRAWTHYAWTMFQNPHLEKKSGKKVQELVQADCDRMGVEISHPKIQRECYGKWVSDPDSFIFKYDSSRNDYSILPQYAGKWDYVIGVDLGHDDADAIAVIGWHPNYKQAYLVEELIKTKQGITELADQIEERVIKYEPLKVVVDSGALGKKIVEEIRKRRGLPLEAAQKSEKMSHIDLLNDAMRTGKFFAKKTSAFAQDCFLVEKDKDKSRVDKIVISDKYHSDICDAVQYAHTAALNWISEPAIPIIKPNTPEWMIKQEQDMENAALERIKEDKEDIWGDMEIDFG